MLATIALARAPDATRYGSVTLDSSGSYIVGFAEKQLSVVSCQLSVDSCKSAVAESDNRQPTTDNFPEAAWLNAGAYVVEREMLDQLAPDQPCSLEREAFPDVLRCGGRIAALTSDEPFFDIGTPDGLETFAAFYAGLSGTRHPPHRMTA